MDLIRYEPFFGKYLFSHQGDLYVVDGPIEQEKDTSIVVRSDNPHNGLSVPAKVQIQVTNRCNFHCLHCYASSGTARDSELTDSEIHALLERCQKAGVLQIEWSGGEPFVRKGFVELLQHAHSLGFEQNMLTNGAALGRKQNLAREVWPYLYAVQVSMNGYGEHFDAWVGKRAWESVLKGITNLVAEKPSHGRVSVATTLDHRNLEDLEIIGPLLSDLGVDAWVMGRQVHNGRSSISEDEADELLGTSYELLQNMREQKIRLPSRVLHPFDKEEQDETDTVFPVEWITEPAARTFMYVSANGDVYPFPYYDGNAEWMSGNVRGIGVSDLWRSEPFARMRAVTREHTGCMGCKQICRMWSRWFNYGRNRDICEPPIIHRTCTSRAHDTKNVVF